MFFGKSSLKQTYGRFFNFVFSFVVIKDFLFRKFTTL